MKRRAWVATGALAVCGALINFAPVLDSLVLFPSTRPIDPAGAVWRLASVSRRRTGSVGCQFGSSPCKWPSRQLRAALLWERGPPRWVAALARIGPAALAAFDEMKRTAGERPIMVSGTSFGTIPALHLAAEREFAGLVLHNPPALREMIIQDHGWWNLWLLAGPLSRKVPAALDSVTNARRARVPAVFLLAERDTVVRPKFQSLVVEAYAGEKRIIPLAGADHLSPLDDSGGESPSGARVDGA